MDYAKLLKSLIKEMKKGVQFSRLTGVYKVLAVFAVLPLIISFFFSKIGYSITLFFYKMISAPAAHLHQWLRNQKDEVQHATQAVMYWICMPFIFFLQVLLSFNALSFFIQWFFLQLQGYLVTLGGITWQPYITEAAFAEEGEYELAPKLLSAQVFSCVVGGASVLFLFFTLLTILVVSEALITITTFLMVVHAIGLYIINPCIFKKLPKQAEQ